MGGVVDEVMVRVGAGCVGDAGDCKDFGVYSESNGKPLGIF